MPELMIDYDEQYDRHVVDLEDDGNHSTSEIIIFAVAQVSDEKPTDLQPLGEVIDPDALDTLFDRSSRDSMGDAHLSFEYEEYEITIFNHGRITISESI